MAFFIIDTVLVVGWVVEAVVKLFRSFQYLESAIDHGRKTGSVQPLRSDRNQTARSVAKRCDDGRTTASHSTRCPPSTMACDTALIVTPWATCWMRWLRTNNINPVQVYPLDNELDSATGAAKFHQQKPLLLQMQALTIIKDTTKLHCPKAHAGLEAALYTISGSSAVWQYTAASSRVSLLSLPRLYRNDRPTSGLCRTKPIGETVVTACLCALSFSTGSTP